MEEKILSPVESDILLVLVKWELVDPYVLVNSLLRKKANKMLERGKSMTFILKQLSRETQLSTYRILKRIQKLDEFQKYQDEKELLSRLFT
jgi:F0F1-type ATP synthase alpha subunit